MAIWSINRNDQGPMKAYRFLGSDLKNSVPHTANSMVSSMCSSVIRNQIANDTIENIIQNRDRFRQQAMDNLRKLMDEWGIWIETIEVIDVKIMSASLFKDMQCEYRDDQYQLAQIQMINNNDSIARKKLEIKEIADKRNQEKHETKTLADSQIQIRNKKQDL